jgi:hypothetical protein
MPKIKTSRTKKAPEGFEEIEPVGVIYRMSIIFYADVSLPRSLMTMGGRCAMLRMNHMKANASLNLFGLSCGYRMLVLDTFMSSTISGKRSARSFTTGS